MKFTACRVELMPEGALIAFTIYVHKKTGILCFVRFNFVKY